MNQRTQTRPPANPRAAPPHRPGWESFESNLASTLPVLKDECLVISSREGNRFVQFSADPQRGLFAETVSNGFLPTPERLDDGQVTALLALGWSAPTHDPDASAPVPPPQGSPNFFRHFPSPVSAPEAARVAVRTLAEVHRLSGPEALEYRAFDGAGTPVVLPALHIAATAAAEPPRRKRTPRRRRLPFDRLKAQVLRATRTSTGLGSLEYDDDGTLPIAVGNRPGIVQPFESPHFVRVYVSLAGGVDGDEALLARMHEMNSRLSLARVIYTDGSIYLAVDFPAVPFHADHVGQAIGAIVRVVDRVARDLGIEAEGDEKGEVN